MSIPPPPSSLVRALQGDTSALAELDGLPDPWNAPAQAILNAKGEGFLNVFDAFCSQDPAGEQLWDAAFPPANPPVSESAQAQAGSSKALEDSMPPAGQGPPARGPQALESKLLSADTILSTPWPETIWAVPGILPAGLTILAGAPKLGKSWLALQIAKAVASGSPVLGQPVVQGPVLYLALEDPPRRLGERMKKQMWTMGLPVDFLTIGTFQETFVDLSKGGSRKLARLIRDRDYRYVAIDTLSRAVKGDQSDVTDMTEALGPLQEVAQSQNCAVLVPDHHRKPGGATPDVVADVLGSTGKGAVADTLMGLYRERGKAGAKLVLTGRDVEERTIELKMDWTTGLWKVEGDGLSPKLTPKQNEAYEKAVEMVRAKSCEIADALGQDRSNVNKRLSEVRGLGLLEIDEEENYYAPSA